jgi:hypothetical protein
MDEFRLSSTARSSSWIVASYRTFAQNSTFTAYEIVSADHPDVDADGLPDGWERDILGGEGISSGDEDLDQDGLSDFGEFVAGTSPTDPAEVFTLFTGTSAGTPDLRFDRIPASGPYYENQSRYYALEVVDDLVSNSWQQLPDATNIPAISATFIYTNFMGITHPARFYRGQVWLQQNVTN